MLQCRPFRCQRLAVFELGIKFLLSYFLGSVMGAMVVGKLHGGVDIRTMGSGNAGGTNALRTQGWLFALGVIVIDVGKGALGAGVVPGLELPIAVDEPAVSRTLLTLCCAAAAVIGHVWPIWHRFRGGKGAATLVGTLTVVAPSVLVPGLLAWICTLVAFGYVGLATMVAGLSVPVYVAVTRWPAEQPLLAFTLLAALFMVYTHRSNVQRMREGTENQNRKVMLLRRRDTS